MGPYCPLMRWPDKPNRPAENNNILAAGEKVGQSGWGRKKKKKKKLSKKTKKNERKFRATWQPNSMPWDLKL